MRVETESGTWLIRRQWSPRKVGSPTAWARFRSRSRWMGRRTADVADGTGDGCAVDLLDDLIAVVAIVIAVLLVALVGIPFLIALGELLVLVLIGLAGAVVRVLFRRPWTVYAVSPGGEIRTWSAVGWGRSGAIRTFISQRVAATGAPPTDDDLVAAGLS